jgi:hypothetical protein
MIIIIRLSRQFFAVAIVVVVVAVVATEFFFLIELRRFRPCKINRVRFRAGDLGHAPPFPEDPYRKKEEEVFVFFFQGLFLKKRNSTKQLWILFCKGHDSSSQAKKTASEALALGLYHLTLHSFVFIWLLPSPLGICFFLFNGFSLQLWCRDSICFFKSTYFSATLWEEHASSLM